MDTHSRIAELEQEIRRLRQERDAALARVVTERQQALEGLRWGEERYRSLFENIDQGFCVMEILVDENGRGIDHRFLETNPAFERHTGLTDAVGKTARQLVPDLEPQWPERYGRVVQTGQPDRFVMGSEAMGRWFEVDAFPIGDPAQHQVGLLFKDVTDRTRAEEDLRIAKEAAEEASRAKSEFLASMSHEIRTPMTVFMAAIEHLLLLDHNPDRRQLLGMADASAKRLRALIDDILDLSRIEARKIEIDEEPFDLRQCVREAVEMFTLPARKKNLQLEMEVTADTPEKVLGDPNRMGQVLINLLGNAVKFTREGEIRISVRPHGAFLEFSVADTGIGIPEEKRHLVFESFSQVDMSFHRQHEGSGLGLAISKGLIELMGGQIAVQSREGEGSVFTFTLPLKPIAQPSPEPPQALPPESAEQPARIRILLADDEPMIRQMVTMMLQRHGLQIETAETGRDALQKWEEGAFDLIFMDLQMPEMNGMEATRKIREKERETEKRTCIVGLTAHVRREIRDECFASGMDQVLVKPVQMNDLFSAVDNCFSG